MTRAAGRALVALALLAGVTVRSAGQDTVVVRARHVLPFDTTRVRPFHRVYDIIVHTRDSAVVIGEREVTLSRATYANSPAWLLVEARGGVVPGAETLYVAPDMRPLQWYSAQREARIATTFVGDTMYGATSTPAGKQNLILAARPDLLVSQPMVEMMLALLPLTAEWADSAAVLAVDMAGGSVVPVELSVIGEEPVLADANLSRSAWVVALRADARTILFWVDKDTGDVYRVQQPLPTHVGTLLEFRRRPEATAPPAAR